MAVITLKQSISKTGINQGDLVDLLTNLVTVVNELVDDHATLIAALDGALDKLDADVTAGGASETNYAAVHGAGGSGAALPATLTNSTNLTLIGG